MKGGITAKNKRFWLLLILLLSVASIRRIYRIQIEKIATYDVDCKKINLIKSTFLSHEAYTPFHFSRTLPLSLSVFSNSSFFRFLSSVHLSVYLSLFPFSFIFLFSWCYTSVNYSFIFPFFYLSVTLSVFYCFSFIFPFSLSFILPITFPFKFAFSLPSSSSYSLLILFHFLPLICIVL